MSYLYCDVCGEAFAVYKPKLVIAYLPEGEPGEVVSLCGACEEKLLDELRLEGPIEEEPATVDDEPDDDEQELAFPIHEHHATCEFELYKFGTAYLRVFIDPVKAMLYREKGIEVVTIGDAYYIIVEIEDKAIISELKEINGYFLAHVTFSVEKDEHGEVNCCKLDKIEVYATFPDASGY